MVACSQFDFFPTAAETLGAPPLVAGASRLFRGVLGSLFAGYEMAGNENNAWRVKLRSGYTTFTKVR